MVAAESLLPNHHIENASRIIETFAHAVKVGAGVIDQRFRLKKTLIAYNEKEMMSALVDV